MTRVAHSDAVGRECCHPLSCSVSDLDMEGDEGGGVQVGKLPLDDDGIDSPITHLQHNETESSSINQTLSRRSTPVTPCTALQTRDGIDPPSRT